MELVERHLLPGLVMLGAVVASVGSRTPDGGPHLGGREQLLGPAVPGLDAGVGRVAAHRVVLQLAVNHRDGACSAGAGRASKKRLRAAEAEVWLAGGGVDPPDAGEVLRASGRRRGCRRRRSASAVARPGSRASVPRRGSRHPRWRADSCRMRKVSTREPSGAPTRRAGRQTLLVRLQADEDVARPCRSGSGAGSRCGRRGRG